MQAWQYSPTDTSPGLLDPYRCGFDTHTAVGGAEGGEPWRDEDWRVPAQARPTNEEASWPAREPGQRPPLALAAADRRRLDLQAALIRAGVAPAPGDLHAVEVLSALDDIVNDTVRRWIAPL